MRSGTRRRWVWGWLSPSVLPQPHAVQGSDPNSCPTGRAVGEAEPRGDPRAHPGHHGQARPAPQRREGQAQGASGRQTGPGPPAQGQDGGFAEQDGRAAAEEAGSARYPLPSPSQPGPGGIPAPASSPPSLSAPPEVLSDEDKLKMSKIKKKMRRKVRARGLLGCGVGVSPGADGP